MNKRYAISFFLLASSFGCGADNELRPARGQSTAERPTGQQSTPQAPMIPLSEGTYWAFGDNAVVSVRSRIDGWFELDGLAEHTVVVRSRNDGAVEAQVGKTVTTWLDPQAPTGSSWEAQLQPGACGWTIVTVEKRNARIQTENGEYQNLIQVSMSSDPDPEVRCKKPLLRRLWLTQGLGLIGVERNAEPPTFLREAQTLAGAFPPARVTVDEVLASPDKFTGKEVQLIGATQAGEASCSDRLCSDSEACCNWCSAVVNVGGIDLAWGDTNYESCAGNECAYLDHCSPLGSALGAESMVIGRFEHADTNRLVLHFTRAHEDGYAAAE